MSAQQQQLIDVDTDDYERVHSATADVDGNRIVISLENKHGLRHITLPYTQALPLLTVICNAIDTAVKAQTGKPGVVAAISINSLALKPLKKDRVHFCVGLGRAELVFAYPLKGARIFVQRAAESLGLLPVERPKGRVQ